MNCTFRYPGASVVLMALILGLILLQLARTGALGPIGGPVLLLLAGAYAGGAIVWVVLHAANRSASGRFAGVRTWPN